MYQEIKELAARNRSAKTAEERAAVKKEMAALQASDPEAYGKALERLIKETSERVDELTVAEQMGEIRHALSMAYIARTYFGKSTGWISQKISGISIGGRPSSFTSEERATLKAAFADISHKLGSLSASL